MARPKNTVQSDNPTQVKILEQEIKRLQEENEHPSDVRLVEMNDKCKRLMDRLDNTRSALTFCKQLSDIRAARLHARGLNIKELREKDEELTLRANEALKLAGF